MSTARCYSIFVSLSLFLLCNTVMFYYLQFFSIFISFPFMVQVWIFGSREDGTCCWIQRTHLRNWDEAETGQVSEVWNYPSVYFKHVCHIILFRLTLVQLCNSVFPLLWWRLSVLPDFIVCFWKDSWDLLGPEAAQKGSSSLWTCYSRLPSNVRVLGTGETLKLQAIVLSCSYIFVLYLHCSEWSLYF